MSDDETLRDWWDGLREIEQFAAYVAERAAHARTALGAALDRDALDDVVAAATDMVESLDDPLSATYSRSIAHDALRAAVKASTKRVSTKEDRAFGLTMDELRVAVAIADQYQPQWRRSLQKRPSPPGE
ncbi:MAG: hypothetical protein IT305_01975 [Chloroflexi bacterium]|nr:hypothetical protein [Chloroflexota bacterium]